MTNVLGNYNTIFRAMKALSYPLVLKDGNTVAWYDSQLLSTITKDGSDFVSRWNDRLGSGHDLLQSTGTNQPKWFSVNGILFDGIDNFMKTAAFTFDQPEFIYIVFKQVTWTDVDFVFDGFSASSGSLFQDTSTPGLKTYAGILSTLNNNLAVDTFGIARCLFNGASSKFIINETTPATGDFGASNMGGFTLGYQAGATHWANIQVKEIILRKVADGATDEASIYSYLANKYGI